ncbi:MAG: hypothetical protein OEV20_01740 [Actinomycetota bacterium]|nr:hypothetical protein [Actinomycetota bacterium]MDH4016039.1 hypothetical protein [Actinomycetota bacterium]
MNRSVVAAGLLTAAATGAVLLVAMEPVSTPAPVTAGQVCASVADLRSALDLSSVGDQAVVRARAAELADMLASSAAKGSVDRAVARRVLALLDDSGATLADLQRAVEPVAGQCPDLPAAS